ncbi:MAG TPA: alpha/beta hydrolase, partial [Acidimicrobiales bacterium]
AAVVCHPHPLYGGDMHNPVVLALVRAFVAAGFAAVRFDFRGVADSGGEHDGGQAERLDALAALELVEPLAQGGPLVMAGYSFGAMVALDVVDPRLAAWVAVAPPLAVRQSAPLAAGDHRPTLLVVPEHDQFSPPVAARQLAAGWPSMRVEEIAMADHFLVGRTAAVAEVVSRFVASL